jgi:hypothetical protein
MVVFDRDREDGPFTPKDPHGLTHVPSPVLASNGTRSNGSAPNAAGVPTAPTATAEWDPLYEMFVTPNQLGLGGNEKQLKNPVSHWRVSKRKILGEKPSFLLEEAT